MDAASLLSNSNPNYGAGDVAIPEYAGFYADWNLPYHFLNTANAAKLLRDVLNSEKYTNAFQVIQCALLELDKIIVENNQSEGDQSASAIDLQVASLSTAIQSAISTITGLKTGTRRVQQHINQTSLLLENINELVAAFKAAWSQTETDPPRKQICNIPRADILGWVNKLDQIHYQHPCVHFFRHAYTHHTILSVITLFCSMAFFLTLALVLYFKSKDHARNPDKTYYIPPLICLGPALFGLVVLLCYTRNNLQTGTHRVRQPLRIANKEQEAQQNLTALKVLLFQDQYEMGNKKERLIANLRSLLVSRHVREETKEVINAFFAGQHIAEDPPFVDTLSL